MNKKIFILSFLFLLVLTPFISASVDFNKEVGDYGNYEIDSFLPNWLGGEGESFVELIENTDQCLIDCHAILNFSNEKPQNLLEDIEFIGRSGKDASNYISEIKFSLGNYQEVEKTREIYEEEVCEEIINKVNKSTQIICIQKKLEEEVYYETKLIWSEYEGEEVLNGLLRIDAKKNLHSSVDWIITFRGKELTEWAWWNSTWLYNKEYTNLNGNISYMEINATVNDNVDFNDTRFISCYNDTLVFNHTLEETFNSGELGQFRVNNLGENCTLRYYGNGVAPSTSDAGAVYFEPISTWYFDANLNDFVGSFDGTCTNCPTLTTGYINGSYDFDGTDEIDIPADASFDVTDQFSFSVWIDQDSFGGNQDIISKWDGTDWTIFSSLTNFYRFGINVGSTTYEVDTTTIPSTGWKHIVGTYDGTDLKIYMNGTEEGTESVSGNINKNSLQPISIGYRESTGINHFNGRIDEPKVYNKALTPEQVYQLYTQTAPNFIEGNETTESGISTTLILPTDNYISLVENVNFSVNSISSGGLNLTNVTFYIWDKLDDTLIYNETKIIVSNTNIISDFSVSLNDSIYLWNAETCGDTVNCTFANSNFTLSVHTVAPTLLISEPIGILPFFVLGNNQTLSWGISENNTNLTEHIVECIYEYNDTIVDVTDICLTINSTNFTYVIGENSLTFNVTDLFGFVTSNTTTWQYEILEIVTVFNNPVVESSTNLFQYHFITPFTIEDSQFNYNDTSYTANIFSNGTDQYRLESTIQVPNVGVDTNITFNFGIRTNNDGLVNSTLLNQTVQSLNVDNCSVFTNQFLIASLFDERTLEDINGSIEANFELLNPSDLSFVTVFTTLYENVHTANACTNLNVSELNLLYNLELRYFQPGAGSSFNYVPEFYNIQKANTNTLPQNISLYDLNVNESSEFTIFYRDDNYVTKANVLLQVLRRYVSEGIFRVVEIPITSSEGSAVAHFDLNNYLYKIIVTEDGEILNVFDNPTIRCESEISGICIINLKGFKQVPQAEGVEELEDFAYFPSQSNESIDITFSSPTGTNKQVRVVMIQTSPFTDPITICDTTILTAAGAISCDVVPSIGDSLVDIQIFSNGVIQAYLKASVEEDLSSSFMLDNYFIGALLLILLIGMGVSSPNIMAWIGVFGLVLLGFIFLLKTSSVGLYLGAITWFVVAAIIVTFKISNRTES